MQTSETFYQIALTLVNGIGSVQAKLLLEHFGTTENIFKAKKKDLAIVEGIGEIKARAIKDFDNFNEAEEEIKFCEKHHINILSFTNKSYPQRLLHCYDAPTVLYYRGNADLNNSKTIAVIGTRTNSEYGKQVTEDLIEKLQQHQVTIISGLAFGIDAIAHKAAIKNNLPTVAVLAHGLQTIYPTQHKSLAKEILLNGGLLTELNRNTKADKHNFPRRNRIVAGMSDATIVIETAVKGGSMITAELAYNYNRDVFAVPAKITDTKSAGCLKLIQQQKAIIYTSPEAFINELGWQQNNLSKKKIQKELFVDLTDDEKIIINLLKEKEQLHIDELYLKSNLSSSSVASAILNLELNNVIIGLPGKMYKIV